MMSKMERRREALQNVRLDAASCTLCPYSATRTQPIVEEGDPRAPIVVVAESARQVDDAQATVLAGGAGKKLRRMLKAAGINHRSAYLTFGVKCYGGREPEFPLKKAFSACLPHLKAQIEAMQAHAVILSGWRLLNWMLLRWSEDKLVDEKSVHNWMGPAIMFRELWGAQKFYVIGNPTKLAKKRDPGLEALSVETLKNVKDLVQAAQTKAVYVPDMLLLKRPSAPRPEQQTIVFTPEPPKTS
jgi:uracil-DNA glycosylase family 4